MLSLFLLVSACSSVQQMHKRIKGETDFEALYGLSAPKQRLLAAGEKLGKGAISYQQDIKPILDSRCVTCHACYDAPCQLKLGSIAGIERGATKQLVYDGGRLENIPPTRLFIDAVNTEEWRDKDFYPVLNERIASNQAALNNSLLAKLLQLKRNHPLAEQGKLDSSFELGIDRKLVCPTVAEFDQYQRKHPKWGMPYALPGLSLKQEYTVMQWLQEGAKFDVPPALSRQGKRSVKKWEQFFNRPSLKQQLVSRYIFEHIFIGHIHFKGHSDKEFYRLVRSSTGTGQPIQELKTRLPYDPPGVSQIYYRLAPVEEVIVEKTHFLYELSPTKMRRYQELFFQTDYEVLTLPTYHAHFAADPFSAFADIPATSRYQFMLDDAQYFVSGFIKGPVCRGNTALGVIRDRFWISFIRPNKAQKLFSNARFKGFIKQHEALLSLPNTSGNQLGLFGYQKYDALAQQYLKSKDEFVNQVIADRGGFSIADLWDGDGHNQNAALTVFRHADSATVVKGLVGDTPLTAWVVDYPLFERIHYLLVAGFDIYSSLKYQLASRKYMDFLRMDGEGNFLRLMPISQRKAMYDSWNEGLSGKLVQYLNKAYYSADYETGVHYQTDNPKQEFFTQLKQHFGKAAGKPDTLNQCEQEACVVHRPDAQMHRLAKLTGKKLGLLPEMSMIRVRTTKPSKDLVYTVLVNRKFASVAFIVGEDFLRQKEQDTLTVVPGFLGSYPNIFFDVQQAQLDEFVTVIERVETAADKDAFYAKFGVRRTHPKIWDYVDWFSEQHIKDRGIEAGVLDLSRYNNL
ncbi:MAG: isomerase [Methyloprofundus sp.]|nr:isomerase [Methyloprofundus sp.]